MCRLYGTVLFRGKQLPTQVTIEGDLILGGAPCVVRASSHAQIHLRAEFDMPARPDTADARSRRRHPAVSRQQSHALMRHQPVADVQIDRIRREARFRVGCRVSLQYLRAAPLHPAPVSAFPPAPDSNTGAAMFGRLGVHRNVNDRGTARDSVTGNSTTAPSAAASVTCAGRWTTSSECKRPPSPAAFLTVRGHAVAVCASVCVPQMIPPAAVRSVSRV